MTDRPRALRLASDFRDCIAALNTHKVTFILVGAYAVGWHGVLRATGDIDFLYEQSEANVARLCAALIGFGAPMSLVDPAWLMSREPITQIGIAPLRIDFIAGLSGVSFDEVDAGAISTELDGVPLRVISFEHLVRNKKSSGRAKDRADVRHLEQLARTRSDALRRQKPKRKR
jgi:hypothetical protein